LPDRSIRPGRSGLGGYAGMTMQRGSAISAPAARTGQVFLISYSE
jgi:hypothetical protein